jgi:hypothetical protein
VPAGGEGRWLDWWRAVVRLLEAGASEEAVKRKVYPQLQVWCRLKRRGSVYCSLAPLKPCISSFLWCQIDR